MEDKLKVFVVDDDRMARMATRFHLEELGFQVAEFDDGAACQAAMQDRPDILLLDVEMSGMNGIDLCRAVRAADENSAQVIFISAHDDLETRLQAYDAGGNDYIVKPYEPEELARKLRVAQQTLTTARELAQRADYARQTAFTAMSSMGEMGVTLDFLRASFVCRTMDELGPSLCRAVSQYGLQCLVKLRIGQDSRCYSIDGGCTPLETSILGNVQSMERIFQFRDRLAINYPQTTLLISNLPLADPDRVGRLRDHLAVIAEGAEMRLAAMANELVRLAQARSVTEAAAELSQTLDEIGRQQQRHRTEMLTIVDDQLMEMENAFVHMGLTPKQEDLLVAMSRQAADRVSQLQDYGLSVADRLRTVTERLRSIVAARGAQGE